MMLERPQLADLVIPDLARWEDWSVMDRLVDLFKNANDDSNWVRVPVINYLRACPLPAAKERIDRIGQARSRNGQAGQHVVLSAGSRGRRHR